MAKLLAYFKKNLLILALVFIGSAVISIIQFKYYPVTIPKSQSLTSWVLQEGVITVAVIVIADCAVIPAYKSLTRKFRKKAK
ncbi:hypothetical protein EAN04_24500 [Salmonella enterica]|nr:hypothetical protein [Salmonella enterica]